MVVVNLDYTTFRRVVILYFFCFINSSLSAQFFYNILWQHKAQVQEIISKKTITVVGANGRTGSKIVKLALDGGLNVNTITRTGNLTDNPLFNNTRLQQFAFDITAWDNTTKNNLTIALMESSACFFAASASKEGGNPRQVDENGLINVAEACIANKVRRLVVISSGAVSKPFSAACFFRNLFGGIMSAKFNGEKGLRRLYRECDDRSLGYTIIRPGALNDDPPRGCEAIEINQGDERSGRISRWDLAILCLESIESEGARRTTIECYYRDTAQPLYFVGISNLFKLKNRNVAWYKTGRERNGEYWPELFTKLDRDFNVNLGKFLNSLFLLMFFPFYPMLLFLNPFYLIFAAYSFNKEKEE